MARLLTLQVTRGVAANLVVLSHLSVIEAKYTGGQLLPTFSLYGIAGVDIFFVLSGFIMVVMAGKGIGAIQFLWRRAARIYPPYWVVSLRCTRDKFGRASVGKLVDTRTDLTLAIFFARAGYDAAASCRGLDAYSRGVLLSCICSFLSTADSDSYRTSRVGVWFCLSSKSSAATT